MSELSPHFTRAEFACRCGCGYDTVDSELLVMLETIRGHFDSPVIINSGCRCPDHNAAVGGSSGSQHLRGRAADIVVKGVPAEDVQAYAETISPGGLGSYENFTHIDSRSGGDARWNG